MNATQMWEAYSQKEHISAEYEAWSFGDDADALAELVLHDVKTATSSAYPIYESDGEELPKAGEYSVILNSRDEAVCIIKTTKVFVVPFCMVDERHAWKEGEGDRSLPYWRMVHERFFIECMQNGALTFDEQMKVVCEEFVRVYP